MKERLSAEELDKKFDEGKEDVVEHFDWSKARRPNQRRRVNVDLPEWMIASLDQEADRLGISRQAVIKTWLAERLGRLRDPSG